MSNSSWILFDGNVIEADTPAVPATSRGLMYGDGCFDTLRSYTGRFLHFEKHLSRLRSSAEFLGLSFPEELENDQVINTIQSLLQKNGLEKKQGVIRIQLWREGGRGYTPEMPSKTHFSVMVTSLPKLQKTITLATTSTRRVPNAAVPSSYKLSNNINYIMAAREASNAGADDALMLTTGDAVSETTIANIFWIKDGKVYTPSKSCDLLPGITRNTILELLNSSLYVPVKEGEFKVSDLYEAEAFFTCNSIRELVEVRSIDGHSFVTEHHLFTKLKTAFAQYKSRQLRRSM